MKKLRRVLAVMLCLGLCLGNTVYASEEIRGLDALEKSAESVELALTKSEQKKIYSEQEAVVQQLENIDFSNSSEKEIDQCMEEILENNYETFPELVQEAREMKDTDKENVYVEDNMPEKTYEVSEGVDITFDGSITTVSVLEESEERECGEITDSEENIISKVLNFGTLQVKAAGKSKIKSANNTKHIYETVHYKKDQEKPRTIKVATAYIEAEFTYNKTAKKCTAIILANYIKVNGLANLTASVSAKKSGVQKPSKSRRVVYQEGQIKYGLTIKGYGLVFGTEYLRVNVICDSNGKIKKTYTSTKK